MPSPRSILTPLLLGTLLASVPAACSSDDGAGVRTAASGGSGSGSGAGSGSGVTKCESASATTVATLKDFTIVFDKASIAAGRAVIEAHNQGTVEHEVVVVKGVPPAELPIADGKVDEDQLPAGSALGEIAEMAPGKVCGVGFDLSPGSYTLFCNVVADDGQSHERKGMVTTLQVQ
jgi:hypothetical protein